jgi:hypothetical protein
LTRVPASPRFRDVIPPTGLLAAAVALAGSAATAAYAACQAALLLFAAHRGVLLAGRGRHRPVPPPAAGDDLPHVTVQLPVYNEPHVVERLVGAAAALDWPAGRLEVQVLDDSTDGTPALAAAAMNRARARGVEVVHLRRPSRAGYKAGALAAGLARARGEFVAVFDADFVPPPDVLRRLLPYFADPGVGMVQARWGHLNRDRSRFTAAQAVMLDAHFLVEHASRRARGCFFNFNGSGGIWRRACIEDAGGWSHATLTEDLDLSYRAQLAGWRFEFAPDVVVPGELPSAMGAFRTQQARWARGSIQTARRVLPELLRRPLPLRVRVEAAVHLTANAAYPLLVALGLLLPPVMHARSGLGAGAALALQAAVLALGTLPVALFLAAGARAGGRRGLPLARDVAAAMVLGAGISLNNSAAVIAGLGGGVGDWVRTPKTGELSRSTRVPGGRRRGRPAGAAGELALAGYFGAMGVWAAGSGHLRALPFLAVLTAGFAWVALAGRPARDTARRAGRGGPS